MYRRVEWKSICNNINRNTVMQTIIRFSPLQIYSTSTASYDKTVSSTYQNGHGCPWRKSATSLDVRLNSQLKNIQGCIFFNVPAVLFCLTPCICTIYLQKSISEAARMPLVLSSSDVLPHGKTRVFR